MGEAGNQGEMGPRGFKGEPGVSAPQPTRSAFSAARLKPLIGDDNKPTSIGFDKVFFINLLNVHIYTKMLHIEDFTTDIY